MKARPADLGGSHSHKNEVRLALDELKAEGQAQEQRELQRTAI